MCVFLPICIDKKCDHNAVPISGLSNSNLVPEYWVVYSNGPPTLII